MFSKQQLIDLYRQRAGRYDVTGNLYYLIGVREFAYRQQAVARLNLQSGDTVVEIGCGTGLKFPLLQSCVGPTGKIIGVDMTDMLHCRSRCEDKAKGTTHEIGYGVGGVRVARR